MRVVIAFIIDKNKALCITKRPVHTTMPGFWEFPGGKVQDNESDEKALIREIKEELGIDILSNQYIDAVLVKNKTKSITFVMYLVTSWKGEPKLLEGQQGMSWVKYKDLSLYTFPETNQTMIEHPWIKAYFSDGVATALEVQ